MAASGRRYQVQHVLGKGGFGTVYLAEMVSSGGFSKPVALKVLNEEMGGMAEVAQRLRDEARLLGRLAADEQRHAALAWKTLKWLLSVHPELRQAAIEEFARPVAVGAEGAYGILDGAQQLEVAERTMRQVVLPCAARLLSSAQQAHAGV